MCGTFMQYINFMFMLAETEPPTIELPDSLNVTAGQEVTFLVIARGAQASDVVSVNETIPDDATFDIESGEGTSEVTARFTWTPPSPLYQVDNITYVLFCVAIIQLSLFPM